jgi:hypothetical protein
MIAHFNGGALTGHFVLRIWMIRIGLTMLVR